MNQIKEYLCRNLTQTWSFSYGNYSVPDIPRCYQYLDFPLYIFLYCITCLFYILWLGHKQYDRRSYSVIVICKMILIGTLLISQFSELLFNFNHIYVIEPAFFIANSCLFLSLIEALTTIYMEQRCNALNSGFYFIYWILMVVLYAIRTRSDILRMKIINLSSVSTTSCIFNFVNLFLSVLSMILSCVSDRQTPQQMQLASQRPTKLLVVGVDSDSEQNVPPYEIELDEKDVDYIEMHSQRSTAKSNVDDHNKLTDKTNNNPICPEYYSSFLSRVSFLWFSPLVWKGYKRPLIQQDLWKINDEDQCSSIVPKFLKFLHYYLKIDGVEVHKFSTTNNDNSISNVKPENKYEVSGDEVKEALLQQSNNKDQLHEINNSGDTKAATTIPSAGDKEAMTATQDTKTKESDNSANVAAKTDKFDTGLMFALLRSYWVELLVSGVLKLLHDSLTFTGPILLKLLLAFIESENEAVWKGYMIALLLLITAIIRSFILHTYFHIVIRIGMNVRTNLISVVYRKSLVLSTWSRKNSTVGEIVNLMSVDSQKFLELLSYLHMIWSGPFQIIVALVFLWMELGASVLGGLAIMLLLIPVNAVVGNITRRLQTEQLKISDSRIKLMNEILNGIKVLKLYAWEKSYNRFVGDIRKEELRYMRKSAYLNAAISFTFNCAPFLVSLTTFGIFVLVSTDNVLDAQKVFVSISLFNILRFPLMMLPMLIANLIQVSVSLKRLTVFLKRNEIDLKAIDRPKDDKYALAIEEGYFSWDPESLQPFLKNIDMEISKGSLVAIVGPVGAGKSSLLSAALGEMYCESGRVKISSDQTISYVPQQAWIVNATIRDNIIFSGGKADFDACKYERVVSACSLQRDLEILPDSDTTEIGEKGINLSGGQKQRISLARACYSNSDIVLLDDPLSAVDSHVARELMEKVLCSGGILDGKTRVLVTHNLTILPRCDRILVLEQGQISEKGTYRELIEHAGPFARFLAQHLTTSSTDPDKLLLDNDDEALDESEKIIEDILESGAVQQDQELRQMLSKSRENLMQHRASQHSLKQSQDEINQQISRRISRNTECRQQLEKMGIKLNQTGDKGKLIDDETSREGNVKLSVYWAYIRSVGYWLSAGIVALFVLTQLMNLSSNLWLVRWSNQANETSNVTAILDNLKRNQTINKQNEIQQLTSYLNHQRDLNLGIYGLFGFAQVFFQLACSIVFAIGFVRSANHLHQHLLWGVLRSPMSLFETIPIGRILNRFSSDLNAIGTVLPMCINGFMITLLQAVSVLVLVVLPNLWIALPIILMMIAYVFMQRFYVASSRQLKRLESVSKSPIYSHFGETLQGVSSIRAYGLNEQFINTSDHKVDVNLYAYYSNIVSNRWLAVILEGIGTMIVFTAAMFSVVSVDYGLPINAGLVGLSVSYALSITQTLNWLVRMSSEVETNIVSVERIEEYSNMPPEAPWDIPDHKPPEDWPSGGAIEFQGYSTRYRDNLDLVLRDISVKIQPQQKIGIVGRTGSGKSSLVLALFRILERVDGRIVIDDLPIDELGLHDVRSRLTIIPQDPVLFSGTLRNNIDPFKVSSDEQLWDVLEQANLKEFIVKYGGVEQLDMKISEGGENLSVGQRQLVCLARALLRRSKILVLDEATAAVDLDTDALIQTTIREQFRQCTILTIAHRLNTVLDYDRIIVLDSGRIKEVDSPDNLLKDVNSEFYSMAKDANLV